MTEASERLAQKIKRFDALAIAVSGGVDSMTLASFAHSLAPSSIVMIHAVSPAVPATATARVYALAKSEGWRLAVTGAGEFEDARYRHNPANRCYFCKSNLYDRIRALTSCAIASGANLDDLHDFRPGLLAAAERNVVHPYVEAAMSKTDVRALARRLRLGELAELPAQPCLASRVETGIAIDVNDLAFVEKVENQLAVIAPKGSTLRCRITHGGVVLEIGKELGGRQAELERAMHALCAVEKRRFVGIRAYARGSMFVRA